MPPSLGRGTNFLHVAGHCVPQACAHLRTRLRIDARLFHRHVAVRQRGEGGGTSPEQVHVVPDMAVRNRDDVRWNFHPVLFQPVVALLQPEHVLHEFGVTAGDQPRKDVPFLVLVCWRAVATK